MRAFAVSDRYLQTRCAQDSIDGLAQLAMAHRPAPLSKLDQQYAHSAWTYFAQFTDDLTGLAPVTSRSAAVGPWEMGATLLAIVSAGRLGLIPQKSVRKRLELCLQSIARLPLGGTKLPAYRYGVSSLRLLSAKGQPIRQATGWSARAIMRLVTGFIVTAHHLPNLAPEISMILNTWRMPSLLSHGRFQSGLIKPDGGTDHLPDLFLGYEQYAARAACLVNLAATKALDPREVLTGHKIDGILIPGDKRLGANNRHAITAEPFLLEALEYGWRPDMLDIAASIFLAQKSRFEQTGQLTAHTEDALDQAPGFAYHAIWAQGRAFTSLSRSGRMLHAVDCLSTKAAFCWNALMPTPYSQKLVDAVDDLETLSGWQTGVYSQNGRPNTALSLNTNAVILEALHYKAFGPLFPARQLT